MCVLNGKKNKKFYYFPKKQKYSRRPQMEQNENNLFSQDLNQGNSCAKKKKKWASIQAGSSEEKNKGPGILFVASYIHSFQPLPSPLIFPSLPPHLLITLQCYIVCSHLNYFH